jgi:hypothetical protein
VLGLSNGVSVPGETLRTNIAAPTASLYYQPSRFVSIRADVDSITQGSEYTRMSPHTDIGSHLVLRIQPTDKLSIEDQLVARNAQWDIVAFSAHTRMNNVTARYEWNGNLSFFGGFGYDSLLALGQTSFIRGTPPLANLAIRDQEVDRLWQGGVEAKPLKNFGFKLAGNYDRTNGLGIIQGEQPKYGPLTEPLVTGTIFADLPGQNRFSLDLQRTYYIQEIITGDNFSADMLTIRWTKSF